MASYTNVGADDYTDAVGVRVDPDAMHAIQLNLNIKWIINCRNGLRPYLTVGEVWTVGESMGVSADGYKLDDLSSLKPYIEYGLGV
ncbi:MAG: autotransporter outer membrane beta-barrel domain-containing protein [Phascolarctobacterium sp.]|nr:autotransporter outer membrane beta-barrel domain-containing protein [Phascolarctobacterium sp.]